MSLVLVALLVVLLAVAAGAVALALSGKRSYRAANEVVPGAATKAPPSWAGAHTPEARLHRRLRDAVRALHAHPRAGEASFASLRGALEQQALAVDERLIAAAALPERLRGEAVAGVEEEVAAVEAAAASLSEVMLDAPAGAATAALDDVREHLRLLAEAREEVELVDSSPPALPGAIEGDDEVGRRSTTER